MLAGLALLRQNGRMLLRLDELDELEFAEPDSERSGSRANRFHDLSTARSKIKWSWIEIWHRTCKSDQLE